MVYYLDSGNPTSPQRTFNPYNQGMPPYAQAQEVQQESILKLATRPEELAWVWATAWGRSSVVPDAEDARGRLTDDKGPHMFKSWFDRQDSWYSALTNLHSQARVAEYQRCSQFHMPDMLTVGMGGQSESEYRAQFFLWSILGAPLLMGNDIREMDDFTVGLVTSPEVLEVDQDKQCVQGSLVKAVGPTETWIKPLSDGSFAVVLLNKGESTANATVYMDEGEQLWGSGVDFFPAMFKRMHVRDLHARKDLGVFTSIFTTVIPPHDAVMLGFKGADL